MRRVDLLRAHGTNSCYSSGCRCRLCRSAHADVARTWRRLNPDAAAEISRRYSRSHPRTRSDAQRKRAAERQREWVKKYPDKVLEYREAHRREAVEASREWQEENRERSLSHRRASNHKRRARRHSSSGSHTGADIRAQLDLQRGRCFYCRAKVGSGYHVDHVVPLFLGGSDGPENIVISCPACNMSKGRKHPQDFAGRLF